MAVLPKFGAVVDNAVVRLRRSRRWLNAKQCSQPIGIPCMCSTAIRRRSRQAICHLTPDKSEAGLMARKRLTLNCKWRRPLKISRPRSQLAAAACQMSWLSQPSTPIPQISSRSYPRCATGSSESRGIRTGRPAATALSLESCELDVCCKARPGAQDIQLDPILDDSRNVALCALSGVATIRRARATVYRRHLQKAEIHLSDAGQFALENNHQEIAVFMRHFLGRTLSIRGRRI